MQASYPHIVHFLQVIMMYNATRCNTASPQPKGHTHDSPQETHESIHELGGDPYLVAGSPTQNGCPFIFRTVTRSAIIRDEWLSSRLYSKSSSHPCSHSGANSTLWQPFPRRWLLSFCGTISLIGIVDKQPEIGND